MSLLLDGINNLRSIYCFAHSIINYKMLRISETESEQLAREYNRAQFSEIIRELAHKFNFRHLDSVDTIYNKIMVEKGHVRGSDIAETLQNILERQKILNKFEQEIQMYRQKIKHMKINEGCTSISREKFMKQFCLNKSTELDAPEASISELIIVKIENVSNISLDKLQNFIIKLSSKIKTVDEVIKISQEVDLEKTNYYRHSEINQANFQQNIQSMRKIISEIPDELLSHNLQIICSRLKESYEQLTSQYKEKAIVNDSLHEKVQEFEGMMFKMEKQEDERQAVFSNKLEKMEKNLQEKNQKIRQLTEAIYLLQNSNQALQKESDGLLFRNQQIENQLKWAQQNYHQLHNLYQQYMSQQQQINRKTQKEEQAKLFSDRTIKQELADARDRIERLHSQVRQVEKQKHDQEANLNGQINDLQQKLKESQETLRNFHRNNQFSQIQSKFYRNSLYRQSNFTYNRESLASKLDHGLVSPSEILEGESSNLSQSIAIIESQVSSNIQFAFKKQKQMISEQISTHLLSNADQKQAIITDQLGINQTVDYQRILSKVYEKQKQIPENKGSIFFSCFILFVSNSERYFPSNLIILQDKMIILDTKQRYNFSFRINQLRRINLCYHNSGWIVLQFKEKQMNDKNIELSDMVFSLRNREEVVQFIKNNCLKKIRVELSVEKEQNIWVRNANNKQIMLSHYSEYYNLFRMTLLNAEQLFQATIKEKGLLNFSYQVFLVVTQIGIIAFQKDNSQLLDRSESIVALIPIVEMMEIVENKEKIQLFLTYALSKKNMKIKMKSLALLQKIKQQVLKYKQMNLLRKRSMLIKAGASKSLIGFMH